MTSVLWTLPIGVDVQYSHAPLRGLMFDIPSVSLLKISNDGPCVTNQKFIEFGVEVILSYCNGCYTTSYKLNNE